MFREIKSCIENSVDRSRIREIEDSDYPGIQSYGIFFMTLEEVFLRVAGCNLDIEDKQEDTFVSPDNKASLVCIGSIQKSTMRSKLLASCNEGARFIITSVAKACRLITHAVWTFIGFISMQLCSLFHYLKVNVLATLQSIVHKKSKICFQRPKNSGIPVHHPTSLLALWPSFSLA